MGGGGREGERLRERWRAGRGSLWASSSGGCVFSEWQTLWGELCSP